MFDSNLLWDHATSSAQVEKALAANQCPPPAALQPTPDEVDPQDGMDVSGDAEPPKKKKKGTKKTRTRETGEEEVKTADVPDNQSVRQAGTRPVARPLARQCAKSQDPPPSNAYAPKQFQAKKSEFVQNKRKEGHGYQESLRLWMLSDERADYLSTLDAKELKRRRFT